MQHWHILGFGAVGQLFSHKVIKAGGKITRIVSANNDYQAIDTDSFTFEDIQGKQYQHHINTLVNSSSHTGSHSNLAEDTQFIQYLLICTKAHQTLNALKSVQNLITNDSCILLLQNGMGAHEEIYNYLLAQNKTPAIFLASTTHGVLRKEPFYCQHTGLGDIKYGAWVNSSNTQSSLTDLPFLQPAQNILSIIWQKLLINCAINAFTVKYDCLNGQLLERDEIKQAIQHLLEESSRIAVQAARNYFTERDANKLSHSLYQAVEDVLIATAKNSSSMREDIANGRETEINYINGYLVKIAKSLNLDASQNRMLVSFISNITAKALLHD